MDPKLSSSRHDREFIDEVLPRRTRVAAERDAWISAAPGRAFEVSMNRTRSAWQITLTERGQSVAVGSGDTWLLALDAALRTARSKANH